MAERKVDVEINGKRFRVAEHLVGDMLKFGASTTKRVVKEPPRELLQMLPKSIILPKKVSPEKPPEPVEEIVNKEVIVEKSVLKPLDLELKPVKKTTRKKK